MTNTRLPTMMPELRLFFATSPAIGISTRKAIRTPWIVLIFFPMLTMNTVRNRIRASFANSVGWNDKGPTPSQRFFPFTSLPISDTRIIST